MTECLGKCQIGNIAFAENLRHINLDDLLGLTGNEIRYSGSGKIQSGQECEGEKNAEAKKHKTSLSLIDC